MSWKLECSNGTRYEVVDEQVNNTDLSEPGKERVFILPRVYKKAKSFKLTMTGLSTHGDNVLSLQTFDVYGTTYSKRSYPNVQ